MLAVLGNNGMQAATEAITLVSVEVRFMTNSDLRADIGGFWA
jgi:hypothetical protein